MVVVKTKTYHDADEGFCFSERARPPGRNHWMNCHAGEEQRKHTQRSQGDAREMLRLRLNKRDSLW